jgi:hypothetical protein
MDGRIFDSPGTCPAYAMKLIPRGGALSDGLPDGSGSFHMAGGAGREHKRITVYYYKPKALTARSRILIVVPGTGRNAHDYRDVWIKVADDCNLLVLSPSYAEQDYDFAAYQMGGVIQNLRFPKIAGNRPNVVVLRDEDLGFELNENRDTWLFNDFDRLFSDVAVAVGSEQTGYDLFGHSAGGQILHRLTLFQRTSKALRIVACNAGFYTLPDFHTAPPFGLKGTPITEADLRVAFKRNLIIGLGGADNSDESGGIQLHTPLADAQGLNRLDRGRYFFEFSRRKAESMRTPFNWHIQVVQGVGHEYVGMSRAFADQICSR